MRNVRTTRWGFHKGLLVGMFFAGIFLYASPSSLFAGPIEDRRAELERELTSLETQIEAQSKILEARQRESVTLERDVDILNAQIQRAKLSIKARNLAIEALSGQIGTKQTVINKLTAKIVREKESLSELLRKIGKKDSYSLIEVVLGGQNLSEFFQDVDAYNVIKEALHNSFTELGKDKAETETERNSLEEKRGEEVQLRKLQELEKKKIESEEAKKKEILKASKGFEAEYQKVLKKQQLSAAQIRAELFTLQGSTAIPFEKALAYANVAGKRTGVRPALILGIIAEESNLGQNVGTGSWRVDMKSPRDTEPFLRITSALGLDP